MVEWTDNAVVVQASAFGDTDLLLGIFTENHGRARGLVKGGQSRKTKAHFVVGAQLTVRWRARLDHQLGTLTCEPLAPPPLRPHASLWVQLMTGLLAVSLPEGQAYTKLYHATRLALGLMPEPLAYAEWERGLLAELGYGIDVAACAVTGSTDNLAFVSPKSGRAVSRAAAVGYEERLLPLPRCWGGDAPDNSGDVRDAFMLLGGFLDRHVWPNVPSAQADALRELRELALFARVPAC